MQVDSDRLWSLLDEVNRFGALDTSGVERLAWTEPEVAARRWLFEKCEEAGLRVDYDEAGNVWAFSGGQPAVMLGSHLDTVPNGGRFDGALGVCSALEVVLSAREQGTPGSEHLGLLCFTDEEGVRFGLGMTGSRALSGDLTAEDVESAATNEGVTLAAALREAHFDPGRVPEVSRRRSAVRCYLEVHVEQGRRLERADRPTGIVNGIVGLSHWRIESVGEANHAGTTLPADRHDALVPIATAALEAQATMRESEGLVATMGEVEAVGGATNIVPGRVRATLDVRSLDEATIDAANERILGAARRAAGDNGCELHAEETKRLHPAPMAEEVRAAMRAAAADLGLDAPEMASMAGHDAMTLTGAGIPCGMVFVRSRAGISHSPDEFSTKEDCAAGASLLAASALSLATG